MEYIVIGIVIILFLFVFLLISSSKARLFAVIGWIVSLCGVFLSYGFTSIGGSFGFIWGMPALLVIFVCMLVFFTIILGVYIAMHMSTYS